MLFLYPRSAGKKIQSGAKNCRLTLQTVASDGYPKFMPLSPKGWFVGDTFKCVAVAFENPDWVDTRSAFHQLALCIRLSSELLG